MQEKDGNVKSHAIVTQFHTTLEELEEDTPIGINKEIGDPIATTQLKSDVKQMVLHLQLEAAQQSILMMEKELEKERNVAIELQRKNDALQQQLQEQQTAVTLVQTLSTQLSWLEQRLDKVETFLQEQCCLLCKQARRNVLLLPCLHQLYCTACVSMSTSRCPHCNTYLQGMLLCK